jgi:hypothetical protein
MDDKDYGGSERDAEDDRPRHPTGDRGESQNQKHKRPNEFGQPGDAEDVAEKEKVADGKRNRNADVSVRSPEDYSGRSPAN